MKRGHYNRADDGRRVQRYKCRGYITGQGELKKIGFDPLFALNHTCAMLRANINRLIRRTWCTSKRQDRLDLHIGLYVLRHNLTLIAKKDRPSSMFSGPV